MRRRPQGPSCWVTACSVTTLSISEGAGVAGKGLRPEAPAPPHQLAPAPAQVGAYRGDKPQQHFCGRTRPGRVGGAV